MTLKTKRNKSEGSGDELAATIAQNLRSLRQKSGLTQLEVGLRLGYPEDNAQSRVQGHEKNNRIPNRKTLKKYADVFGVSVEQIIGSGESLRGVLLLRYLMQLNGMTASDLAEKLGMDDSRISQLTSQYRRIGIKTAQKLGAVFGCDWARFIEKDTAALKDVARLHSLEISALKNRIAHLEQIIAHYAGLETEVSAQAVVRESLEIVERLKREK